MSQYSGANPVCVRRPEVAYYSSPHSGQLHTLAGFKLPEVTSLARLRFSPNPLWEPCYIQHTFAKEERRSLHLAREVHGVGLGALPGLPFLGQGLFPLTVPAPRFQVASSGDLHLRNGGSIVDGYAAP